MTAPASPPSPPDAFLGWVLVTFGGLMVLLCGGCTIGFWGVSLYAILSEPSAQTIGFALQNFALVALVGGLPTAAGVVAVRAGWKMIRPLRKTAA